MKIIVLGLAGIIFSHSGFAQTLDAPVIKEGDTWTYRNTVEKGPTGWTQTVDEIKVARATDSTIYYSQKQSGSTQPTKELFSGIDWERVRDVNGKETVVNKPLSFPLSVGKTWEVQYTEQHPSKTHKYEQMDNKFKVVGYESIEVPAGKFHALKIEVEGRWVAEMEPGQAVVQGAQTTQNSTTMVTEVKKTNADTTTGRMYKAFWYVPEVKRWVKSVEEYYSSGGTRNERFTAELESFKLSQ
jgi:hypothetical protein